MTFDIQQNDTKSKARAGVIHTAHGEIATPVFMPVGTQGTVKALHQHELADPVHAPIILGNTYHLYLRPGTDILQQAGGLHKFIHWDRAILTDSGGYQVYSLQGMRKIKEEGVKFQSHIDGSRHFFSPENVVDIQRQIGADIIMAFDECTPYPCDYTYAVKSMQLTHRWLARCVKRFGETDPLYGYEQTFAPIVQGSTYKDLRIESAEFVAAMECEMNAIGGLSVGEPHEDMYAMTEIVCNILPEDKPRYLMGVGLPENILESIARGIDMFDCVLPTRNARHGILYTSRGVIHIKNAKWETDFTAIDPESNAETSRKHTLAYLRHLFKVGEILALQIASIQNLTFFTQLVREAREAILQDNYAEWMQQKLRIITTRL
ncbi:MAG: tRNA guanosine(34) transglycosylase Tgt [Saprospiraceae bacterium]|nr:tRNA guanosine(34) transglycosylase Tgt [Saprospiraceae bacterium]